ncbi:exonuclease domain-containing protein [Zeaxanthinibacter enoshimensis]|uniref:DNA polymerase-3 subunit epsilon n=1 Tax=Zeaxanthinibacter enoshimensis TaxID=392009 RepID=A0A4R6TIM2_9FLAO|nr:exonuclease domain-containing protein [Zeaxanthinibacter enoshimensis]TDQ29066.1 DNA polymerase-3 subunit epsilon [Zeaxanthinibacter enoshimensis]
MYTIIDIETTGNGIRGNRITEIAVFRHNGQEITDRFTSLVNPQCPIPAFITGLTGIDDDMVRNAPTLEEIVPRIQEITKDSIFVAHSVNFDYYVIKNEFKDLGIDFSRKRLCTVRLSRKLFPGYHSYSLGKLCAAMGIPLKDRHRAEGDAHATVLLFEKILRAPDSESVLHNFLNSRSQEATMPPGLSKQTYDELPSKTGIYIFKDAKGSILYVGKAINIKKRVLSHFYDKSDNEVRLCRETAHIDFECSGNELLALLMESAAIKKHYPPFNRAQKRNVVPYSIFSYEDRLGIKHLAFNKTKLVPVPLATFYSTTDCRLFLEQVCKEYRLCAKYCHLQDKVTHCSHFRIPQCDGICREQESVEDYNTKVAAAIQDMQDSHEDLVIREKGRTPEEDAFILVQGGRYSGYGFVPKDSPIQNLDDLMAFHTPQKNTIETERLVKSYLVKNPGRIVRGLKFEV